MVRRLGVLLYFEKKGGPL